MPRVSHLPLSAALVLVAAPALCQTLPVSTGSHEAHEQFELARLQAFYFQWEAAIAHAEAAIAADPDFPLIYIYRGGMTPRIEWQRRLGYFDRALALAGRATEGERKMIEAFHAFLVEGDHHRAVDLFTELSAEFPDDALIPAHLALRYRQLGMLEEAAEQFQVALARDPDFAPARIWLANILFAAGRVDDAERAIADALRRHPDSPDVHDFIGRVYLQHGRFDEAADHFERALAADPGFRHSRTNRAWVEIDRAHARFAEAFSRGDADALAHLFTENALVMVPLREVVSERAAVRAFWQEVLDSQFTGVRLSGQELHLGDDGRIITEVGNYSFTEAGEEVDSGWYIIIWRIDDDGYKIHRTSLTSDRPLFD